MRRDPRAIPSFALLLATACLPAAGCGGRGRSATLAGSCDNAASGFCVEYTGADYRSLKMQRVCESQKSAFRAGPCPTEGRVGSCLVSKGLKSEAIYRYYDGFPGFGSQPTGGVAAEASRQCATLKGEWIAP